MRLGDIQDDYLETGRSTLTSLLSDKHADYDGDDFDSQVPRITKSHTAKSDMISVNPLYGDPGYGDNCTNCSATWALRRMGYDVEACPCPETGRPRKDDIESTWFENGSFKTPHNEIEIAMAKQGDYSGVKAPQMESYMLEHEPKGSYGVMTAKTGQHFGHMVGYEIGDDKVNVYDSQCRKASTFEKGTQGFHMQTFSYMRVDDKKPNWDALLGSNIPVVRARGAYRDQ